MATKLSPDVQNLVLHFGEMGSRWGINRTVGQIYALLVFSETPLHAEQIADTLQVSRSNVSMGMRELQSWNLVTLRHQPGDRKDYFTVPGDLWDIARTLILERRKRELEPTLTVLRNSLVEKSGEDQFVTLRMREILDFMELIVLWTDELQDLSRQDLDRLSRLGAGVSKVLEFTRKNKKHE